MATDFFERQAVARRNTKWLIAMFIFAVFAIVGTTFVVTALIAGAASKGHGRFPIGVPFAASAAALGLIAVGSLYKTAQLSAGGTVVAERLGGHALVSLIVEQTHTYYLGDRTHRHDWGYGCGTCPACELRANGWQRWRASRA